MTDSGGKYKLKLDLLRLFDAGVSRSFTPPCQRKIANLTNRREFLVPKLQYFLSFKQVINLLVISHRRARKESDEFLYTVARYGPQSVDSASG